MAKILVVLFLLTCGLLPCLAQINTEDASAYDQALAMLHDTDNNTRESGAMLMGATGDLRAVDVLVNQLSDKDPGVLCQVISSLGNLKDVKAVKPLIPMLASKDKKIVSTTISALGDIGDKGAVPSLLPFLGNADIDLSVSVAYALGMIGDNSAADSLANYLTKYIDRTGDDMRVAVIVALCLLNDTRGDQALDLLMTSDNITERKEILRRLGLSKCSRAEQYLIKYLSDSDPNIRWICAIGLGDVGDLTSLEPLSRALSDDNTDVRLCAIKSLHQVSERWRSPVVLTLVTDPDPEIRAEALDLIGGDNSESSSTDCVNTVIKALDDPETTVRCHAVSTLGNMNQPLVVPTLVSVLADMKEPAEVRAAAALALGNEKFGRAAVEALVLALSDRAQAVRCMAVMSLGNCHFPIAVPDLLALLEREKDATVRLQCIATLSVMGDLRAVPALITVLKATPTEENKQEQNYAQATLHNFTGQDFGLDAAKWEEWWKQHNAAQ